MVPLATEPGRFTVSRLSSEGPAGDPSSVTTPVRGAGVRSKVRVEMVALVTEIMQTSAGRRPLRLLKVML